MLAYSIIAHTYIKKRGKNEPGEGARREGKRSPSEFNRAGAITIKSG